MGALSRAWVADAGTQGHRRTPYNCPLSSLPPNSTLVRAEENKGVDNDDDDHKLVKRLAEDNVVDRQAKRVRWPAVLFLQLDLKGHRKGNWNSSASSKAKEDVCDCGERKTLVTATNARSPFFCSHRRHHPLDCEPLLLLLCQQGALALVLCLEGVELMRARRSSEIDGTGSEW